MVEVAYVIGLAMAIINLIKAYVPSNVVPLLSVALSVALNIGNAFLFNGDPAEAGKDAFVSAGILVGLFAASDKKKAV
jgi:hypothetical protein